MKSVVEAAGLTMEYLVYSQVYVTDTSAYSELPSVWSEFFKAGGPALSAVGVTAMPVGTPVEINAIAVTDILMKRAVQLAGTTNTGSPPDAVVAGDRLFFSSCFGLDPEGKVPADSAQQMQLALDRMEVILKAAGIGPDLCRFLQGSVPGSDHGAAAPLSRAEAERTGAVARPGTDIPDSGEIAE